MRRSAFEPNRTWGRQIHKRLAGRIEWSMLVRKLGQRGATSGMYSLLFLFGTLPQVRTVVQDHVQQGIMDLQ